MYFWFAGAFGTAGLYPGLNVDAYCWCMFIALACGFIVVFVVAEDCVFGAWKKLPPFLPELGSKPVYRRFCYGENWHEACSGLCDCGLSILLNRSWLGS